VGIKLPPIIQKYIDSSNRHDVNSILSCFSDDAVVRDEREEFDGKDMVESWIVKTIEKYKFKFKPLSVKGQEPRVILVIEVSGAFPGSPVTLDYHITLERDKILSLTID
jgi:ketosteroid isomerase-like protein